MMAAIRLVPIEPEAEPAPAPAPAPPDWQPTAWNREAALLNRLLSWPDADFARVIFYRWMFETGRLTDWPSETPQEAEHAPQPV